jgi:predicted O-linked N-acetylglucosamine transferase (SPINDLY family)
MNPPSIILEIIHLIQNNNLERNSNTILSAVRSDPNNLDYLFNIGVNCAEIGKVDDAIVIFESLKSCNIYDAKIPYSLGYLYVIKHNYKIALTNFNQALKISPDDLDTLNNYASTLHELKQFDDAITFFDKALTLNPDCAHTLTNKGVTLLDLKRYDEAIAHHNKALKIEPQNHIIWKNKATLFKQLRKHSESAECYLKASELCLGDSYFLGEAHHQMLLICDWADYNFFTNRIFNKIQQDKKSAEPFGLQGTAKLESLLKKCAEIYSNDNYPSIGNLTKDFKYAHNKIHIGYLCGEFREHATSILMTGIWELHDKEKFKIFAFDSGYNDNSKYRKRINLAFDKILDISKLSDLDSANLIKSNQIDILINLNGYFGHARQGIFSYKPSPIQVNFLGFPGTLGAPYIDYMIADKVVLPLESREHYSEKIIYLPDTYQPNDNKRQVSDIQLSKSQVGLPNGFFVFACFSNVYKITPDTFDLWVRILRKVDSSVLWLLSDNPMAKKNLVKEAVARGIDSSRLIFAEYLKTEDHLARHRMADLFLDTLPYNAHTTCSDALWAGLPVLTLKGSTFPGRVAASLLNAIGLPELITHTPEEYEALAIRLATNPKKLAEIKLKLSNNRLTTPLFDSLRFTKHLEAAYFKIHERYQAGLEPDHFAIT